MPKVGQASKGSGANPLVVFRSIWKAATWTFINGKRIELGFLQEARDLARANGFTGIKVRHP